MVGAKPNAVPRLPCVLCRLFTFAVCCFFSFSFPFLHVFNDHSHSHSLFSSRISLSFFWGSHCISKHVLNRIVYVLPTSTGLVSFLSCHYSSFFLPLCLPHLCPFWGFACSRGGGRCFVLSCSCPVLPLSCRVPKLIDRPFPSSVSSLVYFTCQLLIHKQTSG